MTKSTLNIIFVLVMILVIVSVDVLFFKDRFWARLIANVIIVLVFAVFYWRYLK